MPAVLEMLGIPYTGSDPLTLAVTLDKDCAKRLVSSAGVAVPRGGVIFAADDNRATAGSFNGSVLLPGHRQAGLGRFEQGHPRQMPGGSPARIWPVVVESLQRDHRQPVLVEEFIEGDELTVGMLGNDPPQVLGIMRVLPRQPTERFVYSLEVKRDWEQQVRYECPAQLSAGGRREAVRQAALAAYRVLGCRDVARIDFRLRGGRAVLPGSQSAARPEPGDQRPGHPGPARRLELPAADRDHPAGRPGPDR